MSRFNNQILDRIKNYLLSSEVPTSELKDKQMELIGEITRNAPTNSFDYFYHNKMFYQNKYNQKIINNLKISNNTMINLKNFVKKQKQNNFYNSNINNNLKQ